MSSVTPIIPNFSIPLGSGTWIDGFKQGYVDGFNQIGLLPNPPVITTPIPVITITPPVPTPVVVVKPPIATPAPIVTPNPISVGPTPLPLTTDLATFLSKVSDGTEILLSTGVYKPSSMMAINAKNVTLNMNGASIVGVPIVGGTSCMAVYGSGFTMFNGQCSAVDPMNTFIRAFGQNLTIHSITGSSCHSFVLLDRNGTAGKDLGGSDGAYLYGLVGQNIYGDFIYSSSDNLHLANITVLSSVKEHNVRVDISSTGHVPSGGLFENLNLANANGKETLTIRQGNNFTIKNSAFNNWVEVSHPSAESIASVCANIEFDNCNWGHLYQIGSQLLIAQGCSAVVNNCTFLNDAKQVSVSIGANTSAKFTNNIRKRTTKGLVTRPVLYMAAPGATPVVQETGTTIIDPN